MDFVIWFDLVVWLATECWIAFREIGETDTSQDRHTKKVFALCAAAAISIALLGPQPPQFTIFYSRLVMLILGSLTMFIGITIRVLSVLTLGNYFRTTVMVQKGQKIVRAGLYKYLRHPSYLGALITVLGFGIVRDNWFTVCTTLVIMVYGVAQRIAVEEEVMQRAFGKEYFDYKKKTYKLIPKIY